MTAVLQKGLVPYIVRNISNVLKVHHAQVCNTSHGLHVLVKSQNVAGMDLSMNVLQQRFTHDAKADASGMSGTSDADTFGLLAEEQNVQVFKYPTTDLFTEMNIYGPLKGRKSAAWYHAVCKAHAKSGKIEKCVEVLETRMLQKDKVNPLEENFTVVIGALGRVGDCTRAFMFYNKLKEYGLTPSLHCYTALANAVANSCGSADMDRLKILQDEIKRKRVMLNRIVYIAIMKAYAKRTNFHETMDIFRESIVAGFEPDVTTFSMLLMSCENDKQSGFRHAVQVWKQMIALNIKPNGMTISHLLRVVRKCGIGEVETANKLLLQSSAENLDLTNYVKKHIRKFRWLKGQESLPNPDNQREQSSTEEILFLNHTGEQQKPMLSVDPKKSVPVESSEEPQTKQKTKRDVDQTEVRSRTADDDESSFSNLFGEGELSVASLVAPLSQAHLPNILRGDKPTAIVSLSDCVRPHDRLNLIGGHQYVLDLMKQYDIAHSVKIFTLLAEVLEPSYDLENELMAAAWQSQVKLDIDFYNCVLRKRLVRRAFHEGQEIIDILNQKRVKPNYRTWCIYAMSKTNHRDGKQYLDELSGKGIKCSVIIMHTLIKAALRHSFKRRAAGYKNVYHPDYRYLTYLISRLESDKIPANEKLIRLLETAAAWPAGYQRWVKSDPRLEKEMFFFRKAYNEWLKEAEVRDDTVLPNPSRVAPQLQSGQEACANQDKKYFLNTSTTTPQRHGEEDDTANVANCH